MEYSTIKPILIGLITGITVSSVTLFINNKSVENWYIENFAKPESAIKAISRCADSIVNVIIENNDTGKTYITSASGIIMRADGYVITNYHVIQPAIGNINHKIRIQLRTGTNYYAQIIGYDRRTDIAVVKITTDDRLPVIPINEKRNIHLGDTVYAIGNPYNLGQTITHGIISAIGRTGSGITKFNTLGLTIGIQDLIQTDAPINSGNSGGALVNSLGEFVGISTATLSNEDAQANGISFAIPHGLALRILEEIIENGRVIRGYLGIDAKDIEFEFNNEKLIGLQIETIDPNGPANEILYPRDIIIKINETPIKNLRQSMDIIADTDPNTTITFELIRNNRKLKKKVKVEEQSSK